MNNPLVSAIIPTYNRASFISEAVHSIMRQTYPNIEIIVVDDGSTDNTYDVLRSFKHRIRVIEQPNRGPSAARNLGFLHSKGSLVAFLDSDDVWLPDKIERQVELLARLGPRTPCCLCNATFTKVRYGSRTSFDLGLMHGNVQEGLWKNPFDVLASRFVLFNQVAMIRRQALEITGGFREDLWLLEDYDLAIRLSLLGPWGIIRKPLVIKHDETPDSLSMSVQSQPLRELRAKEMVLKEIVSNCNLGDSRVKRSVAFALLNIKLDVFAQGMANGAPKATSGLGRFLLMVLHLKDAAWRRSPWWPNLDVLPVARRKDDYEPIAPSNEAFRPLPRG